MQFWWQNEHLTHSFVIRNGLFGENTVKCDALVTKNVKMNQYAGYLGQMSSSSKFITQTHCQTDRHCYD